MKNIIFLLLALIFTTSCERSSEDENSAKIVDSLENEIYELKQANDTLSDLLMQRAYTTKIYPSFFDSIKNPEEFVLEKLQEEPSLIPKDAVLGGTMRFTTVDFINENLVLASYEDGHVLGKAIYSYRMNRNGQLVFTLISAVE